MSKAHAFSIVRIAALSALAATMAFGLSSCCKKLLSKKDPAASAPQCEPSNFMQCSTMCAQGSSQACYRVGVAYDFGKYGAPNDDAIASTYYVRACNAGYALACNDLGVLYSRGEGVEKDLAKAATYYKKCCDGGEMYGCANEGRHHLYGWGVPKNEAKGISLLTKACEAGNNFGCGALGSAYATGRGVTKDDTKATGYFRQGCAGNDANSCNHLGWHYATGEGGLGRDDGQAIANFKKACDLGNSMGCVNEGEMWDAGRGEYKDRAKAVEHYKLACDQYEALGCNLLAGMYEFGEGVPKSAPMADLYYRKGCNPSLVERFKDGCLDGDDPADDDCAAYGACLWKGIGTTANRAAAAEPLKRGCKWGISAACNRIK